jgi:hypothetical protein
MRSEIKIANYQLCRDYLDLDFTMFEIIFNKINEL